MKIRNGFVSNSSSSSFIAFGKPIDVCEAMIQTILNNKENIENQDVLQLHNSLDMCRNNPDVISGRYGLSFNSGGYDAKMFRKDDDSVYVYTSNYENWSGNLLIDDASDNLSIDDILIGLTFIWLPTLIIYKNKLESVYNKGITCPKCGRCYAIYPTLDNKLICQDCKNYVIDTWRTKKD